MQAERAVSPDSWAGVPEIAGQDYHQNAKVVQRLLDSPKLTNKILSHITKNEMLDQVDDNTNFLGYCDDN
jgi:hypothetical protein